MKRKMYLLPVLALLITACNNTSSVTGESSSSEESSSSSSSVYIDPRPEEFLETDLYTENIHKLEEYSPTTFDQNSLTITKQETLSQGVELIVYSYALNNSNKVYATTLEVDLNKADIRTNYSPGSSDILYTQMTNFAQTNTDVEVIAGINADFFGRGGNCVNAYIKDYKVIKSSHNDNGIYDYTNLNADLPASMPMLLGVQDKYARIGPIVEDKTVEETVKSKFEHKLMYAGIDKVVHQVEEEFSMKVSSGTNKLSTPFTLITEPVRLGVAPGVGDKCYILEMEEGNYKIPHGKISEIWECDGNRISTDDTVDGYGYLFVKADVETTLNVGDYVGYVLGNEDGKFDGYGNVIGGRQSLIENGEIAPTLVLENSNGAQSPGVPRSCVGIKDDGKLLICAVEGLRYGKTSSSDEDGYGVSLPQLADFLREINVYDAMNFDGGGSTSIISRNLIEETDYRVDVRSSDYGKYDLTKSRKIYNCLLVTTKSNI